MIRTAKRIALLGSTGSIGLNAVAVIEALGEDYQLVAASAHGSWEMLAEQAVRYSLERVVLTDGGQEGRLREALAGTGTEVLVGPAGLEELARDPGIDTVIVAVVGAAGLPASLAAVRAGKTVAIANKESLVVAGCLLVPLAKEYGATLLPVDSEHSAILQAMQAGGRAEVEKIIITGSGGPFRERAAGELAGVTVAEALNHPTWRMGPKITIDSATLMNKALEVIEARWLFDMDPGRIELLIHPESVVHSLVEFCDGSVIAQMSPPDMRLPIQYALTWPRRVRGCAPRLDLRGVGCLTFCRPDAERFPAVRLGFEVAERGGTAGAVLNAANEAAVEAFRAGRIGFTRIAELVERCLEGHGWVARPELGELVEADRWARQEVGRQVGRARVVQG